MSLSHATATVVKYDEPTPRNTDADNIVRFPRPWMFELNLQPRALGLALAISQWTLKKGWCYYSASQFAQRLGWSERTVKRGFADLRGAGILDRHRRGVRLVPPLSPPRASTVTDKKRKGDNGGPATKEPIKILTEPRRKERASSNPVAEVKAEPDIEPLALVSSDSQDRESQNHQKRQDGESLSDIEARLDDCARESNATPTNKKAGRLFEIRDALGKGHSPDALVLAVDRAAADPWVVKHEAWGDIVAHTCKNVARYLIPPAARWRGAERGWRVTEEINRNLDEEFPDEQEPDEPAEPTEETTKPTEEIAAPPVEHISLGEFQKRRPELFEGVRLLAGAIGNRR